MIEGEFTKIRYKTDHNLFYRTIWGAEKCWHESFCGEDFLCVKNKFGRKFYIPVMGTIFIMLPGARNVLARCLKRLFRRRNKNK